MAGRTTADDALVEQMAASLGLTVDEYLTKYFGGRANYQRLCEADRDAAEGTGDAGRRRIEEEIAQEIGVSPDALRTERERSSK